MNTLLEKFDAVEIKSNTRLAKDDQLYCEMQQELYVDALKHYREMFKALQELKEKDDGFSSPVYSYVFVEMDKEKFSGIVEGVHNIFIEKINSYFREKYRVTIDGKKFNSYVGIETPEEPRWGYAPLTAETEEHFKQKMSNYQVELNEHHSKIINAELNFLQIVDDIFLSLDGFSFVEKVGKEIKDASSNAVENKWNGHASFSVKNAKIAFDILSSYKCHIFKRYEIGLNSDAYKAILRALTYFDTNHTEVDIYNGWLSRFVAYRKIEGDGIYDTHDVGGDKVKQFKFYKNGKFEVFFDSRNNALKFAREFLGYDS